MRFLLCSVIMAVASGENNTTSPSTVPTVVPTLSSQPTNFPSPFPTSEPTNAAAYSVSRANSWIYIGDICKYYFIIFIVQWLVFEIFRSDDLIYNSRTYHYDQLEKSQIDTTDSTSNENKQRKFRPRPRPRRLLGWLKPVFDVSESDLLSYVGLDMFVMLRYIKLCIHFSLFSTLLCLIFLVPSYQAGSAVDSECQRDGSDADDSRCQREEFNKFTLSNIDLTTSTNNGDRIQTIFAIVAMYVISFQIILLIRAEYRYFRDLRTDFLSKGDIDSGGSGLKQQTLYTVMVENIPKQYRLNAEFRYFFDHLFPVTNQNEKRIFSTEVVMPLQSLMNAVKRSEFNAKQYENSLILKHKLLSRNKPIPKVHKLSFLSRLYGCLFKFNKDNNHHQQRSGGGEESMYVDVDEYWRHELLVSNKQVKHLQHQFLTRGIKMEKRASQKIMKNMTSSSLFGPSHRALDRNRTQSSSSLRNRSRNNTANTNIRDQNEQANILSPSIVSPLIVATDHSIQQDSDHVVDDHVDGGNTDQHTANNLSHYIFEDEELEYRPTTISESEDEDENVSIGSEKESIKNANTLLLDQGDMKHGYKQSAPATQSSGLFNRQGQTNDDHLSEAQSSSSSNNNDDDSNGLSNQNEKTSSFSYQCKKYILTKAYSLYERFKQSEMMSSLVLEFLNLIIVNSSLLNNQEGSTGFVTFYKLSDAAACAQLTISHKSSLTFKTSMAPEPRALIWENLMVGSSTTAKKKLFASLIIFFGMFWFALLISFYATLYNTNIYFLTNSEGEEYQIPEVKWLGLSNDQIKTWFSFLPVLFSLGTLLVAPWIFLFVATNYESYSNKVEVEKSIFARYFDYYIAYVIITILANIVTQLVKEAIHGEFQNISQFLSIAADSLPTSAGYFISVICLKTLFGCTWEMSRLWPLMSKKLEKVFLPRNMMGERHLKASNVADPCRFGWIFPQIVLVVAILFIFQIIVPFMAPFSLVYFCVAYIVFKQQALYVYANDYESGGMFLPLLLQRTLTILSISQFVLFLYLSLNQSISGPIAVLPLPFITLYAKSVLRLSYEPCMKQLSYDIAVRKDKLDAALQRNGKGATSKFKQGTYAQPWLYMGPSFVDDKRHPNVDPRLARSHTISPLSSSSASDFFNTSPSHSGDGGGGGLDNSDPSSLHAYHYHHHQFEALLQEEIDHYVVLEGGGNIGEEFDQDDKNSKDGGAFEQNNTAMRQGNDMDKYNNDDVESDESANMVFSSDLMYAVLHPEQPSSAQSPKSGESDDGLDGEPNTPSSASNNSIEGISLHDI